MADNREKYDFLRTNYFEVCRGRHVLEIGPFHGWITEVIREFDPASITLIESADNPVEFLRKHHYYADIVHGDMHYDLRKVGKVDVVIALGVIYHSHAPLLFLEEIANWCDPDILIVDNPGNINTITEEIPNQPGMRYTAAGWKTCDLVCQVNDYVIEKACQNLGFEMIRKDRYPINRLHRQGLIWQFEKIHG